MMFADLDKHEDYLREVFDEDDHRNFTLGDIFNWLKEVPQDLARKVLIVAVPYVLLYSKAMPYQPFAIGLGILCVWNCLCNAELSIDTTG